MRAALALATLILVAGCEAPLPERTANPAKAGKPAPEGPPPPVLLDEGMVCAADVKICPDGSAVSRDVKQGCAFPACPAVKK